MYLASSDAIQLSFEGNDLIETVPPSLRSGSTSLFTRYLVEGLRTGEADLDNDGDIALDELYWYVHARVTEERPQQRPTKKEETEGRIFLAQNINWTLPSRISNARSAPYAPAKLTALEDLRGLHNIGNAIVKERVMQAVHELADDDSRSVSAAANQFLSDILQEEDGPTEPEAQGEAAEQRAAEQAEREAAERRAAKRPSEGRAPCRPPVAILAIRRRTSSRGRRTGRYRLVPDLYVKPERLFRFLSQRP